MTDWLKASRRAKTPEQRSKFLRLHQADYLRTTIKSCRECPLNHTRKNSVPFDGNPPKPIAIVGEAPGQQEDKEGVPFVGRSGSLLRQMLETSGYERSQAVVMNVVACRPPKNRTPDIEEVEACAPHFDAQLKLSGAWIVLLLGQSALNRIRPGVKIGSMRGIPFWQDGRIWMPTYHPAYVLRNRSSKAVTETDMKIAFDIAYDGRWREPVNVASVSDKDKQELACRLDREGFALWDSARLDDRVVVVRNHLVKIPVKHSNLTRYSVEELIRVGEFGKGGNMTKANLQAVHEAKRLGGTIVA